MVTLLLLLISFVSINVANKNDDDDYSIRTKFAIGDAELSETNKLLNGYFSDISKVIV